MFKFSSLALGSLLAVTLLFSAGCQKVEEKENSSIIDSRAIKLSSDPIVQEELMFMKTHMGYNLSDVLILKGDLSGDYGIQESGSWEGEHLPRKNVQEAMELYETQNSSLKRHRVHSYMSTSGSKGIVIISGVPSSWNTAVGSARVEWNNLAKSLSFSTPVSGSYSSGKVNVSYVSLASLGYSSSTIAITQLPSPSGVIGAELRINSDYTTSLTASQRKFVIAHELGHAIGFRHTDSYDGLALVTLNYACSNVPDASSVLRPGTSPVPSWSAFSSCDIDAFDYYYGLA